jgi:saccharopine dehydrogenase (NAD+, L-lysine forming)
MKIGIIREGKVPADKRVPFSPELCIEVMEKFPQIQIIVQPSTVRAFSDESYSSLGIVLQEDLSSCDVLMGVKEVPLDMLIPNKKYFFFSHTFKEQPYNRKLLKAILDKKIQLIDYETLTDKNGQRIIGFGRFAGIVGAYKAFRGWGEFLGSYSLKPTFQCKDRIELEKELTKVKLPANFKMVMTGGGRVGSGAREIVDLLGMKKVEVASYLNNNHDGPVFCQLDTHHYTKTKDGSAWEKARFYAHPQDFESDFYRFAKQSDLYIACHYWDGDAPMILTNEELARPDLRIKFISDVSCDMLEPIASTLRPSTIADPFYGYDPKTGKEVPFKTLGSISVQAVDNLPCELPVDASVDFGKALLAKVIPFLVGPDPDRVIERASETDLNGKLTADYSYLDDYVNGVTS